MKRQLKFILKIMVNGVIGGLVLGGVSMILAMSKPVYAQTADSQALGVTKNVLNYMRSLPNRVDEKVISGQNIGWASSIQYDKYINSIFTTTGKKIALIEVDWDFPYNNYPFNNLITHWNDGGLISVLWRPFTGQDNTYIPPSDIARLYTPGTADYAQWVAALDAEAVAMARLQAAGVVVLWRPLNEMNGDWCWWCNQDQTKFINLWKFTFNYLTSTKGLHNLLWVYSPVRAHNTRFKSVSHYYPGSNYVDIVGVDYYRNRPDYPSMVPDYEKLLALGKPFALTEFGPDNTNPPIGGNFSYDYTDLIQGIKHYLPKTAYFVSWRDIYALVNQNNARGLLNDSWVVNQGEMPNFNLVTPTPIPTQTTTPTLPTLIIDDQDPKFAINNVQDSWQLYTQANGQHYNGSHHYNSLVGGGDTAAWSFSVPQPGRYQVFAWWWATNYRPTDVPFSIVHFDGQDTVKVNQQLNGGQWNLLGEYNFMNNGKVTVSDQASNGKDVVADAIKLVRVGEPQINLKALLVNWLTASNAVLDNNGDGKVNSLDFVK